MSIAITEIEPELYQLAQMYFDLKPSHNVINYTEDGRVFLTRNSHTYNIIISDVYYSFFSIPIQFTTKEFFQEAKESLTENGVFIGNFVGNLDKNAPSFIFSEMKTFKNVFENSYFFAVDSPNSTLPQNIIFLGINGTKQITFDESKKSTDPILNGLDQKTIEVNKINFDSYQIITDNYAPIEYMVSKVINRVY